MIKIKTLLKNLIPGIILSILISICLSIIGGLVYAYNPGGIKWMIFVGTGSGEPLMVSTLSHAEPIIVMPKSTGIPDNNSDWVIGSNTTPYFNNIIFTIDGTEVSRYEPTTMIVGAILPDETGSNDGTITWGTNPDGIEISIGSITSYESTTASVSGVSGISHEFEEAQEPEGWFVSGTFGGTLTPELKESFANAATAIGMPEQSLWLIIWFGVSIAIGLSVLLFTGSILISLVIIIAGLWAGTNAGIIDFGLVFLVIVLGFGVFYLVKQS